MCGTLFPSLVGAFALLFITWTVRAQREFVFIIFLTKPSVLWAIQFTTLVFKYRKQTRVRFVKNVYIRLFICDIFIIFYVFWDKTWSSITNASSFLFIISSIEKINLKSKESFELCDILKMYTENLSFTDNTRILFLCNVSLMIIHHRHYQPS